MNNHQTLASHTEPKNEGTKNRKHEAASGLHFDCQFREHCKCSEGKERQSTQKNKDRKSQSCSPRRDDSFRFSFRSELATSKIRSKPAQNDERDHDECCYSILVSPHRCLWDKDEREHE